MSSKIDIRPDHLEIVQKILHGHLPRDVKIWVFGSRATWKAKDYSDLDLALEGNEKLSRDVMIGLEYAFEESDLPWKVDLLDVHNTTPEFLAAIERDKVLFPMEAWLEGGGVGKVRIQKLSEIADVIDSLHKTPIYSESGRPMVRVTDVRYGYLNLSNTLKVDEKVFKEFSRRYTPTKGDIVITRVGSYGNTALVNETNFCLGQNTAVIIPHINYRYLYFVLNSRELKNQIEFSTVGSTQKTLSLKAINNLDIPRFSEVVEESIAKTLGDLDDKIAMNQQINRTLEAMAQALFKSWFVDFEPTRARVAALGAGARAQDATMAAMTAISGKPAQELAALKTTDPDAYAQLHTTANLFPSRLVDSELGEIPEGWKVRKIEDEVARLPVGKKFSSKTALPDGIVPILDQGKSGLIGFHNEDPGVKATPEDPIIVFANHTCYMRLIMHDFSAIQNVLPFKPNSTHILWLYFATLGKQKFNEYKGHWPDFMIKQIIIPNNNLDGVYASLIQNSMTQIYQNELQSQTLTQLRDSLLPKLLSGKISVNTTDDTKESV